MDFGNNDATRPAPKWFLLTCRVSSLSIIQFAEAESTSYYLCLKFCSRIGPTTTSLASILTTSWRSKSGRRITEEEASVAFNCTILLLFIPKALGEIYRRSSYLVESCDETSIIGRCPKNGPMSWTVRGVGYSTIGFTPLRVKAWTHSGEVSYPRWYSIRSLKNPHSWSCSQSFTALTRTRTSEANVPNALPHSAIDQILSRCTSTKEISSSPKTVFIILESVVVRALKIPNYTTIIPCGQYSFETPSCRLTLPQYLSASI